LERRCPHGVPADLKAAIRAATDLERFDRWLDLAVGTASPDEFQRFAPL